MDSLYSRNSTHSQLKKLLDTANEHNRTPLTASAVQLLLERGEQLMERAQQHQEDVLTNCIDDEAAAVQYTAMDSVEETYLKLRIKLYEIRATFATPAAPTSVHHHTPSIRLPKMELPTFSGNYDDWPSFENLFSSTIDKNTTLSGAQKLQYLISSLRGEAALTIKSFAITDANYGEAWTLLTQRYSNKREIVYTIINKLYNFQPIKYESAALLQSFYNTILETVRQLKVLGRPVDKWDDMINVLIINKLDRDTKAEWARSLHGTDPPTLKEVTDFLDKHIRSLIARGALTTTTPSNSGKAAGKAKFHQITTQQHDKKTHSACSLCDGTHDLYQCQQLINSPPEERMAMIKKTTACLNCLRDGHQLKDCYSRSSCRHCGKRHHTLLHTTQANNQQQAHQSSNNQHSSNNHQSKRVKFSSNHVSTAQVDETKQPNATPEVVRINLTLPKDDSESTTILKTAQAYAHDSFGNRRRCRLLIDDGSEAGLINNASCNSLGLQRNRANIQVTGVGGGDAMHINSKVTVRLFSYNYERFIDVELLVSPRKITGTIPHAKYEPIIEPHLKGIPLADPEYYMPGDIDILLGADSLSSVLLPGLKKGSSTAPIAQNTIFGWALMGKKGSGVNRNVAVNHVTCGLEELVERFWKIEDIPSGDILTKEEQVCESNFMETHERLPDGRYQVRLPFNSKKEEIGETRELALRRLYSLEKRFQKNPEHKEAYCKFMREYLELGHMEEVKQSNSGNKKCYYIPHHFVIKEDSSTTKLRVVFDASMKSTTGVSLNDALLVGPTIQNDLFTHLIRFRLGVLALVADIEKMYRQFLVHPHDCDFQRILWRENPSEPVREFILKTLTYGTGCAAFLAVRCLQQLAMDEEVNFPRAVQILMNSLYVDDLLKALKTRAGAEKIIHEMIALVKAGGMQIRKWCSNDNSILEPFPTEIRETVSSQPFDNDTAKKALGVRWLPEQDVFSFQVNPSSHHRLTKRTLLAEICKTFDPIGWISPVTVNAKILFQDLWRDKTGWDDPISSTTLTKWNNYSDQLHTLSSLKIPRCIVAEGESRYEIHSFCDSSEKCYATAIYLKTIAQDGSISINLITSKTKVAPIKQVSLPRLELCGAVLLAETTAIVKKALEFECEVFAWTDSMIVLQWLQSESRRWKTFVANRVSTIQKLIPASSWRHVRTHDNPADLPSRGITPTELINSTLWWHGPKWLKTGEFPEPPAQQHMTAERLEEKNQTKCHNIAVKQPATIVLASLFNLSSLQQIISTVGWWRRYFAYLRNGKQVNNNPLSATERRSALYKILASVQADVFEEEIRSIKSTGNIKKNSNLKALTPLIDNSGLLRVGGRLRHANITENRKHPIIIPSNHKIAELIVREYHHRHLHGGATLTLNSIRNQFWIINGRNITRKVIGQCIKCKRVKAVPLQQQMGDLPSGRTTPNRPFLHSGVDLAGPLMVKMRRGRGSRGEKCWIVIFVCFSTKAVHLDVVTDLSTDAFMECYKRFIARRGIASHMYSDCGTNFIGADKVLKQLFCNNEKLQQQMGITGTTWHFNPPSAPHQGGIWEAAVKSTKYHLRRVMGDHLLTLEQFQTVLCNVEACLNSRPLCALTADPLDLDALTPGHFLVGHPLTAIPDPDITQQNWGRLTHWQQTQQISQHFWRRWSNEYLQTLQQRGKWHEKKDNLIIGDLVVIRDELSPPTKWKLGRVIATHPGSDGLVRKVTLRTATGELIRPIQKLSILLRDDGN